VEVEAPKLKVAGAGASCFFSPSALSSVGGLSARTSPTILLTAADGFFGVSAGLAPKVKGEEEVVGATLGVKPFGVEVAVDGAVLAGALAPPNENPPEGALGSEKPPAGGAGIENPVFFGSSAFFAGAGAELSGFQPAVLTVSSRCLLYWSARPGNTSPRFTNASLSNVEVKKERIDVLSPRIEV